MVLLSDLLSVGIYGTSSVSAIQVASNKKGLGEATPKYVFQHIIWIRCFITICKLLTKIHGIVDMELGVKLGSLDLGPFTI